MNEEASISSQIEELFSIVTIQVKEAISDAIETQITAEIQEAIAQISSTVTSQISTNIDQDDKLGLIIQYSQFNKNILRMYIDIAT